MRKTILAATLCVIASVATSCLPGSSGQSNRRKVEHKTEEITSVEGHWSTVIQTPDHGLNIRLSINLNYDGVGMVKATWAQPEKDDVTASAKIDYTYTDGVLTITFLDGVEPDCLGKIFDRSNRYKVRFDGEQMILGGNAKWRNVDVPFGQDDAQRGFCRIDFN